MHDRTKPNRQTERAGRGPYRRSRCVVGLWTRARQRARAAAAVRCLGRGSVSIYVISRAGASARAPAAVTRGIESYTSRSVTAQSQRVLRVLRADPVQEGRFNASGSENSGSRRRRLGRLRWRRGPQRELAWAHVERGQLTRRAARQRSYIPTTTGRGGHLGGELSHPASAARWAQMGQRH